MYTGAMKITEFAYPRWDGINPYLPDEEIALEERIEADPLFVTKTSAVAGYSLIDGPRPSICLYNLSEAGANFDVAAPLICASVLAQIGLTAALHEVDWTYVNGCRRSAVTFEATGGVTTEMVIANPNVLEAAPAEKLTTKYYREHFAGFCGDKAHADEDGMAIGLRRFVISIPGHPQQWLTLDKTREKYDAYDTCVLADSACLRDELLRQNKPKPPSFGSGLVEVFLGPSKGFKWRNYNLLNTALEAARIYVAPHLGHPPGPATIAYDPRTCDGNGGKGRLDVVDGLTMIGNLAKLGAPFVPVELKAADAAAFSRDFAWRPQRREILLASNPAPATLRVA